jgi:hypothetical protein
MARGAEQEQASVNVDSSTMARPAWQPLLQKVKSALGPRPPAQRTTQPQQGGFFKTMFKMVFGMLIFVVGAETIGPLIAAVDLKLHLGLEKVRFAPPNTPLLGGLTGLLLIWFLAILGLWLVLRRFDIIPRNLYGTQPARAGARTAQQRTTKRRANQPQVTTLRSGPPRTRAERRHAAEATAAVATEKGKGTAKAASKSASGTTPRVAATRSSTARTSSARNSTARTTAVATKTATNAGDHDDAYARARAAERDRRRRARR